MKNSISIIDRLQKEEELYVKSGEDKIIFIILTDNNNQEGAVKIYIDGSNSNVQILGTIIGSGKQQIKLYTFQDHIKKESVSDLLIKSVLFDEARLAYEGLIKIEKDAQKSNAYQKNQNLLIGKSAWADSRPKLEILANDVRCTHGATIGKINEEEIFYLATRGLERKLAEKLIIKGFLQEVVNKVTDVNIKIDLEKKIEYKIDQLLKN
ncbi:SufD family Fe-S cluster assembly protein [Candidatus Gottesmanbacteria bacterium]|nr:SufD family Fe-S cluster assembly protein [Candidatus Gottesmanbacteria bacterium]